MAGIGVDVVAAKTGFHQFVGRVTFPNRPLPGTEHADRIRAFALQGLLVLFFHNVEGLVPANRLEFALFVELAFGHAQQRLGQAVHAVHDLGEKIALHAIEAAIDLGLDVPVQGDHVRFGNQVTGGRGNWQASGGSCDGRGLGLDELSAGHAHSLSPAGSRIS
ncbi:hypothetical protein D3C86_1586360 [compost metagenome]